MDCPVQTVLHPKMREFPYENVTVFTVLCREEIHLKVPVMLSSRTFTKRGTPKAKSVMMWTSQKLLRQLTVVFSVFKCSHWCYVIITDLAISLVLTTFG